MRISYMRFQFTVADLNAWLADLLPDVRIRIQDIKEGAVHGQLKFLMWNVDFVARPHCNKDRDEIALEISAHKFVAIPISIVERQLQEAMKDAPEGIEVLRQNLKVHVPSILEPLDIKLKVTDFACRESQLIFQIADCNLDFLKAKLPIQKPES